MNTTNNTVATKNTLNLADGAYTGGASGYEVSLSVNGETVSLGEVLPFGIRGFIDITAVVAGDTITVTLR